MKKTVLALYASTLAMLTSCDFERTEYEKEIDGLTEKVEAEVIKSDEVDLQNTSDDLANLFENYVVNRESNYYNMSQSKKDSVDIIMDVSRSIFLYHTIGKREDNIAPLSARMNAYKGGAVRTMLEYEDAKLYLDPVKKTPAVKLDERLTN